MEDIQYPEEIREDLIKRALDYQLLRELAKQREMLIELGFAMSHAQLLLRPNDASTLTAVRTHIRKFWELNDIK